MECFPNIYYYTIYYWSAANNVVASIIQNTASLSYSISSFNCFQKSQYEDLNNTGKNRTV